MVFLKKGFVATAYEQIFLRLINDGSVYGYDLATRFEKVTKGHMKVSYGTVYPFLRRMEKRGLITSSRDDSSGRVYYELTPNGKQTLEKSSSKMKENRKDFDEKLLGFLEMYSELFGRDALKQLLRRLR